MDEKKPFGDYIRKKRLEAGLTQKELAGRLYVTESGVSKWERNLSYPDVSLVTAICRELHISEHEFFTACDDDRAHAQARAEAVWRGAAAGLRRCCLAGYIIAIPICLVCNMVLFHTLDWFWIVLSAIALSFCFTNLPSLIYRERAAACLGAASVCLLLLLLACWYYAGGRWLLGGLAITAASLALPWGWWAIWRFFGKHVLPLCVAFTSVWVFPMLAVIHAFAGGGWLWRAAFPLAGLGVAFLWAYFLCLRYLPTKPWLKAGVCTLITALASPAFNGLCRRVIPGAANPWLLDGFTLAVLLALAVVLLALGGYKEVQRRNL